ncbi:hypothetical protein B0H14DRAFT_3125781 [Mycena olivaceomarginata]|nr:hypothetical protein B0H14DRAFT_3125781 [Mycena olivaceomarginata]
MTHRLEENHGKRKRLSGACDLCRRRKVRSQIYAAIQEAETPSTHRHKSAQDHIEDILSTSTIYIPSNDVTVSHEILVAVAKYARDLEETVAKLRKELHVLTRRSPASISLPPDSVVSSSLGDVSGQFQRHALEGTNSTTPNLSAVGRSPSYARRPGSSMSMVHPFHSRESELLLPIPRHPQDVGSLPIYHPSHRELNFDGMQYRPDSRNGNTPRGSLSPQSFYPVDPAIASWQGSELYSEEIQLPSNPFNPGQLPEPKQIDGKYGLDSDRPGYLLPPPIMR